MKGSEVQRTESPFLPSSIASHLRGGSLTSLVVIQVALRKGQLDCREREEEGEEKMEPYLLHLYWWWMR